MWSTNSVTAHQRKATEKRGFIPQRRSTQTVAKATTPATARKLPKELRVPCRHSNGQGFIGLNRNYGSADCRCVRCCRRSAIQRPSRQPNRTLLTTRHTLPVIIHDWTDSSVIGRNGGSARVKESYAVDNVDHPKSPKEVAIGIAPYAKYRQRLFGGSLDVGSRSTTATGCQRATAPLALPC